MSTRANDHHGIRVGEMDRAIRFYADAFGAEPATRPFTIDGEFAEEQFEGPAGVSYRLCHLRFDSGMIELFEFTEPHEEPAPVHPTKASIMHIGFVVDDVTATAARVVEAGGRMIFPVTTWGANRLTYVADPDGNVIEIADAPLEELLVGTMAQFPESDPRRGAADG
jgi:predicted enzyme related to lactoylglutathione lyase